METNMKTFTFAAAAALLLATTAAHAGNSISFQIDGHKVHIEAPRDCDSLSCIKISAPGLNLKGLTSKLSGDDDDGADNSPPPAPKLPPIPAPAAQVVAPQAPAPAPVASNPPSAPTAVATNVPAAAAPVPVQQDVTPATSAPVAAAAPAQQQAPVATPTTPVGIWQTQDNKGNVRIEQCGANLCGYADKTNERILINMKPQDGKWAGRIHDPEGGSTYDSTIAMKGANVLKVQGCAFGGLFCGGQTWKRVS
jgi:uncharacterized protein (DUF2147 family)